MTTILWTPETSEAVAASDPNLFNFEGPVDPQNPWGTDYLTGGCHAVISVTTAEDWELARSH